MNNDFFGLFSLATNANNRSIFDLFSDSSADQARAICFSVDAADLFLDYSKQNITACELSSLLQGAKVQGLTEQINAQFTGEIINNTEKRAVLHTVLRAPHSVKKTVLGNQAKIIQQTEDKMAKLVDDIAQGKLTAVSGKKYTDVLAIGIGGSYYGIKVCLSALHPYHNTGLKVHVLANVDGAAVTEKLEGLDPQTTLVIIISKTFTTQETMLNAKAVKNWMQKSCLPTDKDSIIDKQWYAVSSDVEKVKLFGVNENNILPMWDWVGGRFSLWSAVGLPLALAIGNDNFSALKQGAYEMDLHFTTAPVENNMPVLLAVLGLWNRNGLGYPSLAILPYDHALRALPGYLQQTDMESNGKSVSKEGVKLPWLTAPVVFGQEGTNGQHAFMQLMHQSDDIIPTDFIVSMQGTSQYTEHHKVLVANCFAQSEALMQGKTLKQAEDELFTQGLTKEEVSFLAPHKTMKGNTPSNTLVLKSLDPQSLGALLALYEHKIFVQGALWQLNSYDQWGVELGKVLGNQVLSVMNGEADNAEISDLSASSLQLINRFTKSQ